jgi:hypothetical protein
MPFRNVVILGRFNPAIIQPEYFRRYKIFPEQEIAAIDEAVRIRTGAGEIEDVDLRVSLVEKKTLIISNEFSVLFLRSFALRVEPDKFTVDMKPTADEQMVLTGIKKLFTLLRYTPVTAIGFNFDAHWKTSEGVHQLKKLFGGDPKKIEKLFGKDALFGGQIQFTYQDGRVSLLAEPSVRLHGGIYFRFNFHFEVKDNDTANLLKILPKLPELTEKSLGFARELFGEPEEVVEKL